MPQSLWLLFTHEGRAFLFAPRSYFGGSWFNVLWCRMRGHPAGVIWYSSGWEPNMHCKNCGDDLG